MGVIKRDLVIVSDNEVVLERDSHTCFLGARCGIEVEQLWYILLCVQEVERSCRLLAAERAVARRVDLECDGSGGSSIDARDYNI